MPLLIFRQLYLSAAFSLSGFADAACSRHARLYCRRFNAAISPPFTPLAFVFALY